MPKLVEYITPTWIPEKEGEYIPIYDPAIDGERIELVRCKDCKYRPTYPKAYGAEINGNWCYWCELHRAWKRDDWFCGDGERKEHPDA